MFINMDAFITKIAELQEIASREWKSRVGMSGSSGVFSCKSFKTIFLNLF